MGRRWPWVLLILLVIILVAGASCGIGFIVGATATAVSGTSDSKRDGPSEGSAVAVIYVLGTITSSEADGSVLIDDSASSGRIVQDLRKAQQDNSVKAIVLRVDSPGGGVTASDEIYAELVKTKRIYGKTVVVSVGSLAASGGYYISAPADKIIANPTSLVGSIGVISIVPNIQGLLDKLGVQMYVFKSDQFKDFSSGFRPQTEEEKLIWQSLIQDSFDRFVMIVAQGRGMELEQVRRLADGRIYTARQAKDNGLIDDFGDLPEAIQLAADTAGIKGKPRVIYYKRSTFLSGILNSFASYGQEASIERMLRMDKQVTLKYLYTGP